MNVVFEWGLSATRWLQSTYPQMVGFWELVSEFGRFEFYLLILPLVYWCLDKRLGVYLAYLIAFSALLNTTFKATLRGPRPYWLPQGSDLGLAEEASYGIPSGHVQTATVFYLALAVWLRRRWLWVAAFVIIFLMAVSRAYLGVHFVHDVVAGFLLALIVLVGDWLWRRYWQEGVRARILGQRLLLAICAPLAGLIIYAAALLLLGAPQSGLSWAAYSRSAEIAGMEDMAQAIGILIGLGIGFTLETSYVSFTIEAVWWKRVARYLLGMVGTLILWRGLALAFEAITPPDTLWLALPLRFLRYLIVGLWVAYYAPRVFVWLRLAGCLPEPEARFTVAGASLPGSKERK